MLGGTAYSGPYELLNWNIYWNMLYMLGIRIWTHSMSMNTRSLVFLSKISFIIFMKKIYISLVSLHHTALVDMHNDIELTSLGNMGRRTGIFRCNDITPWLEHFISTLLLANYTSLMIRGGLKYRKLSQESGHPPQRCHCCCLRHGWTGRSPSLHCDNQPSPAPFS